MISALWISSLGSLMKLLGPLSLILVGFLVQKKYVGRVATFTNVIAINLHTFTITNPTTLLIWYANIGLIIGIIALFSYGSGISLNKYFYSINYAYCSFVTGGLILLTGF